MLAAVGWKIRSSVQLSTNRTRSGSVPAATTASRNDGAVTATTVAVRYVRIMAARTRAAHRPSSEPSRASSVHTSGTCSTTGTRPSRRSSAAEANAVAGGWYTYSASTSAKRRRPTSAALPAKESQEAARPRGSPSPLRYRSTRRTVSPRLWVSWGPRGRPPR